MSILDTKQVLLERLIATKGIAVRSSANEEAFWYTSGLPGPFYINTENIAGKQEAKQTLEKMNHVLGADQSKQGQTKTIMNMIIRLLDTDPLYSAAIDALTDYYISNRSYQPAFISGGERRDWFFSIPVARKLDLPHVFLFKNGEHYITDPQGKPLEVNVEVQSVLHVADIINQASSYLKRWIPILRHAGAAFTETLSVAVRSEEGVKNLTEHQVSIISPLVVGRPLFEEALRLGLINEFAYNEIRLYEESPENWTRHYLHQRGHDGIESLSESVATKKRIAWFKSADPYGLKSEFAWFFS